MMTAGSRVTPKSSLRQLCEAGSAAVWADWCGSAQPSLTSATNWSTAELISRSASGPPDRQVAAAAS